MTNLDKFNALLSNYHLDVDNKIEVGGTGYLDRSDPTRNYIGIASNSNRAFINLAVVTSRGNVGGFVIFQRYTIDHNIFTTGGAPWFMSMSSMLHDEDGRIHFDNLKHLLDGGALFYYDHRIHRNLPSDLIKSEFDTIKLQNVPQKREVPFFATVADAPKDNDTIDATIETVKQPFFNNIKVVIETDFVTVALAVVAVGVAAGCIGYVLGRNA